MQTKTKKTLLIIVCSVFLIMFCSIFVLTIVSIFQSPESYETANEVIPKNEVYGNKTMNLVSTGTGKACAWNDKILIATIDEVIAVSPDFSQQTKILDSTVSYLNVVNDMLYYEKNNNIYMLNLNTLEKTKIFNTHIYAICAIHVIDDKLYYLKSRDISYIGCIDLQTMENKKLNCEREIDRIAGYRMGIFYYTDAHDVYAYDLLNNKEERMPIDINGSINSIFLESDKLFMVYENQLYAPIDKRRVKIYDLDSKEEKEILLSSNDNKSVYSVIALEDRIVYEDGNILYIYNMTNDDLIKVKSEGKCRFVYGVNGHIVAGFINANEKWYAFYDIDGNEIGTRIKAKQ